MKTFKDAEGREWAISLNVTVVTQVRSAVNFDLLEMTGGKAIEQLLSDPVLLCNVLYVICRDQAETRNLTDEDFGRGLAGDAIDLATEALLAELLDFFPSRKREPMARALAKFRTVEARGLEQINQMLDSPELEAEIEKRISQIGGQLFGARLPSSASTPDYSPCDSSSGLPTSA